MAPGFKVFVWGFILGFSFAALVTFAGTAPGTKPPGSLTIWSGEGSRPGLYYAALERLNEPGTFSFYDCKALPPVKVKAPPPSR
jgi:hypothetical protein